ncbi:MAG: metal ABC transporter permease [Bacteroidetes bacterium]|nr:metal ABC transporter permease [Bacteroidota bacterium]
MVDIQNIIDFLSLKEANVRYVVLGTILLSVASSVIGCFALLRKRALIVDSISHSVLPGVCIGFMISGTKDPLFLLGGAMLTGWLSIYFIDIITRYSKIKADTAIGLNLSVFFAVGILLLTIIQNSGNPNQSGLSDFLFGKAATMVESDMLTFGGMALLVISGVALFYKQFVLISFDMNFAKTIGLNIKFYEFVLSILTVMAVAIGIQTVGVVLMAAMLITPAATARYWTDNLRMMLLIAAVIGAFSGIAGAFISYTYDNMPTGPWIVIVFSLIAIASMIFAPRKGIVAKWFRQKQNSYKIMEDNILKAFYHLGEKEGDFYKKRTVEDLMNLRKFERGRLLNGLKWLSAENTIVHINDTYVLSKRGKAAGERIVRIHRLWELYLKKYLRVADDHVHDDAETIEHIITPELELQLEKLLDYPEEDQHNKKIPYSK